MSRPLAIFLHSHHRDRVFQAVNLLATASAAGEKAYLFLFYGALATYMDGSWDDATVAPAQDAWRDRLQQSLDLSESPSLYALLDSLRGDRGLTVYACSTSMRYLGLDSGAVLQRVDQVAGLAAMLDLAAGATALYI